MTTSHDATEISRSLWYITHGNGAWLLDFITWYSLLKKNRSAWSECRQFPVSQGQPTAFFPCGTTPQGYGVHPWYSLTAGCQSSAPKSATGYYRPLREHQWKRHRTWRQRERPFSLAGKNDKQLVHTLSWLVNITETQLLARTQVVITKTWLK